MMTTSVTTQTKILQPASENLKRPFVQWGRRWILSVLALVVLATSAAGIALAAIDSSTAVAPSAAVSIQPGGTNATPAMFGCSGELVIANLGCELGVATAFDTVLPVIYQPEQNQPLIHIRDRDQAADLAPWCNGQADPTIIYGCTTTCQDVTDALVVVATTQAVEDQCAHDVWIGDILFRLEAGKARAHTCLTQVDPLPACIP